MPLTTRNFLTEQAGVTTVRMLSAVVAGKKPRAPGDVLTLPAGEAAELLASKQAERVVAAPKLVTNL